MAAGYATRLYPLTHNMPKALLPVGGKAMIDILLEKIFNVPDVDRIYVVSNDKFYLQFVWWLGKNQGKDKVEILNDNTTNEENRLGAVGDLLFAINEKNIDDELLVIAGDNLFSVPLNNFVEFAKEKEKVCIGVYDVFIEEIARKFGVVKLDDKMKIVKFDEKPEVPETTLISTACYYFPKNTIGIIRKYITDGNPKDRLGDFIAWLSSKEEVYGFNIGGKWCDIGSVEEYERVRKEWK